MSWESLVVGRVVFKEGVDESRIEEIVGRLSEATESEWHRLESDGGRAIFEAKAEPNWVSHVKGERIKEVIDEYLGFIHESAISVYYLDEPDEDIYYNARDTKEAIYYGA